MKQIESEIETHDTYLHALVNSDSLNQTKLSCKIDTSLKNIITSIEQFGELVAESKPCELSFVRRKDKQAQMMVAKLQPLSGVNIQLNLKKTKGKTSKVVLYFQKVEWYFRIAIMILSALSIKMELNYSK